MLVLKYMKIDQKLEKLQCTFPKLTEANQQYVLGLVEGLKRAQSDKVTEGIKEAKTGLAGKRNYL